MENRKDSKDDWRLSLELLKTHTGQSPTKLDKRIRNVLRKLFRRTSRFGSKGLRTSPPENMSSETFTEYLYYLTTFGFTDTTGSHRPRSGDDRVNKEHIAKTMDDLMHRPDIRAILTPESLHIAIRFYCKHRRVDEFGRMFNLLTHVSFCPALITFELLLGRAAHDKDLAVFAMLLHRLIDGGLSPNAMTWYHFLASVRAKKDVQMTIWREFKNVQVPMSRALGLKFLAIVIEADIQAFINQGGSTGTFLSIMESRLGKDWLSGLAGTLLGNKIINYLRTKVPLSVLGDHLDQMIEQNSLKPDRHTASALMATCLHLGNPKSAFAILHHLEEKHQFRPDRSVHRLVMTYALKKRLFNVAKVIWTSACYTDHVNSDMRSAIIKAASKDVNPGKRLLAALETNSEPAAGTGSALDEYQGQSQAPQKLRYPPRHVDWHGARKMLVRYILDLPLLSGNATSDIIYAMRECSNLAYERTLRQPLGQILGEALVVDDQLRMYAVFNDQEKVRTLSEHPFQIPYQEIDRTSQHVGKGSGRVFRKISSADPGSKTVVRNTYHYNP